VIRELELGRGKRRGGMTDIPKIDLLMKNIWAEI
jgi:hypothetical protein